MPTWTFPKPQLGERDDGLRLVVSSAHYCVSHDTRDLSAAELVALFELIEPQRDKADVRLLHAALLAQVPVGARLALSCDYEQEDERLSVEEVAARIDRVLPCALPA